MGSEIKGCCSEVYCYMRLVQIIEETVHFLDKWQYIHCKNFIEDKGEVTYNQGRSGIYLHIDTCCKEEATCFSTKCAPPRQLFPHLPFIANVSWASPCFPNFSDRVFFRFIFVFLGPHLWHMEVPRLGLKSKLQLQASTAATAKGTRHGSATYTTAQGNPRSFTLWVGPGIEPTSSCILVRFITAGPEQNSKQ